MPTDNAHPFIDALSIVRAEHIIDSQGFYVGSRWPPRTLTPAERQRLLSLTAVGQERLRSSAAVHRRATDRFYAGKGIHDFPEWMPVSKEDFVGIPLAAYVRNIA